jgi:hypothetical protein
MPLHGLSPFFEQREFAVRSGFRLINRIGRALKRQPANQDRHERLRVDLDASRIERDVDAACVPEAGVVGHVFIVRGVDEDMQRHAFAVGVKRIGSNLADLQSPEEYG